MDKITVEQALQILQRMADSAILPQSSKSDHVAIQIALETIKATIKVEEVLPKAE